MTGSWAAALTLCACAVASWPRPPVLATPAEPAAARGVPSPPQRRAVLVGVAVLALALLGDWWPWWLAVLLAGTAGAATLPIRGRPTAHQRTADRRLLAVHGDLLAACLDAGIPIGGALLAAGAMCRSAGIPPARDPPEAVPLQLLDGVAALLMLGADPTRAWATAVQHPDLAALAAAAGRSSAGGTTLADAVRDHASALRAAVADEAERSAGRAGVAMTAPLGLCFLPAFLCLGLAPVVVGLLSTLQLF